MSAQLKPSPQLPGERPEYVQAMLAASVYGYMLRDGLSLLESDARAIKREYGLPTETQLHLGYRSAPQALRFYSEQRNDDVSRWLDSLSEDEFLDWFTFSKQPLYTYVRPDAPATECNLALNLLEQGIAAGFGELQGIAGLYVDDGLHIKMPRRGIIAPCRIDSIIRALLVYPRPGEDQTFWLSSNGLNGGASARASLHIANQSRARRERVCMIVKHTIEADAIGWESGECVVATNGLSPLRLLRELRLALPDLKGCAVVTSLGDGVVRTLRENGLRVRLMETEGVGDV